MNLRTQLKQSKTSQARTRSALNVLSEKQDSQEQDLATLKNELRELREQQKGDKDLILQLQTMASDNGWGIANLKGAQDQLKKDFITFKKLQERQNNTVVQVEEFLSSNDQQHKTYHSAIRNLQKEMMRIRKLIEQDRTSLNQFKQVFDSQMTRSVQETLPLTGPEERTNKIPTLPLEEREEQYNAVQTSLAELSEKEQELAADLDHFNGKFVQYDGELARIYSMYFNLSLQLSQLENKLLIRQQQVFQSDLHDMQRMFVNFTQQIINMDQQTAAYKKAGVGVARATRERHQDMSLMSATVTQQGMRLRTVEDMMSNYQRANRHNLQLLNTSISRLNVSLGGFAKNLAAHNTKANNVFVDVDDKLMEYHKRIKSNLARLTSIEVKVLNASLEHCRKTNQDLVQDIKLADVGRSVTRMNRLVSDQNSKIAKMDHSVSQLFEENKDHLRTIEGVKTRMNHFMELAPKVTAVQREINNIICDLPRDCTEVGEKYSESGQYLVKPDGSLRSVRVYCEFDDTGSWLVVQRRVDGAESFDRTWREYSDGFGDLNRNFWLGNDYLHYFTSQKVYKLHIEMTALNNELWTADYNFFQVGDKATSYKLHVGGYHGNGTDALKYSNEMPFSTKDSDNDVSSTHCAKFYTAGWWYKHCHYCNLNGRYTVGIVWFNQHFDEWVQMHGTKMMIQLVNATMLPAVSNDDDLTPTPPVGDDI